MTRRGSRSTATHVQRVQTTVTTTANGTTTTTTFTDAAKERDFLLRRHQMLRRAAGYMLAKKYRTPWYAGPSVPHGESLFSKTMRSNAARVRKQMDAQQPPAGARTGASKPTSSHGAVTAKTRGYTREELINFWKDLPPVAKRALLRIHRDVYLAALDQYLVRQNLCCECHDNVIAEWEDLERRRSGSRSLQDVFSVFPPFLDDDDEDEDDEDDDDEEEDEEDDDDEEEDEECEGDHCRHHHHEFEDDLLDGDDVLIEEEEEVVFKYELEGEELRRASKAAGSTSNGLLSDEYLAALEVGKRQEDELMRLIQKEERYIIIREDHSEFIMDLIRCGEQFSSYVAALRPALEFTDDGHESSSYDDEDEDAECPGANTSHLAQEYLLEVLAIKFREQLESAYQAALQHSLAVQAELLREEIAELQRDQKQQQQQQQPSTSTSKNKKKKEKKKKKKKSDAKPSNKTDNTSHGTKSQSESDNQKESTPETSSSKKDVALSSRRSRSSSTPSTASKKARSNQLDIDAEEDETDRDRDNQDEDSEAEFDLDDVDREVEEFRLLLEKINAQRPPPKSKPKLVLPPGAFSMMA